MPTHQAAAERLLEILDGADLEQPDHIVPHPDGVLCLTTPRMSPPRAGGNTPW